MNHMKSDDLISRSALCGKQEEMYIHTDSGKIIPAMAIPVWVINNAPAVDAEPVIRCKDCEEYIPWGDGYICGLIGSYFGNTKPDDFCSRAVKKDAMGE